MVLLELLLVVMRTIPTDGDGDTVLLVVTGLTKSWTTGVANEVIPVTFDLPADAYNYQVQTSKSRKE